MWFRHLKFKEPESPHDPSSALYLQQRLLQSHKRDFHAQEWFILEDCTDDLEKLCRGLDKAKAEITVKKTDTEDVKVDENVFKDEIACMKKLFGLGGKKVFPVNEATMALLKEEDDKSGSK